MTRSESKVALLQGILRRYSSNRNNYEKGFGSTSCAWELALAREMSMSCAASLFSGLPCHACATARLPLCYYLLNTAYEYNTNI